MASLTPRSSYCSGRRAAASVAAAASGGATSPADGMDAATCNATAPRMCNSAPPVQQLSEITTLAPTLHAQAPTT
eukprot:365187-Chlamydomonas_euryale.AAC.5